MRTLLLCLSLCLAVGASFGAYEYIISGYPAANPSNAVTVSVGTVNAQTVGNLALASALETRYRTFSPSGAWNSMFYRSRVGAVIIVR